ncbi:hypothetical protein Bca52824_075993 [Brassica carinata]|uniref:leucine--tRNA ligase n=1 Tax=Brassica carinata TaxID=52824 RepID=A0A8X7PQP8_BRACI|nr:hypothetical protein Bca52824_075993 [Brassica carinata]
MLHRLLEIEVEARKWWEDEGVFLSESRKYPPKPGEKFFATFPFPYMNGYLRIGHAFSLSKADFASAYHRLRGANVLLPFGFHCTGMTNKASADKLSREIQQFGNPHEESDDALALPDWFRGKMSKAAANSGGEVYQWEIMRQAYGLGCDWRRSFVTTDVNPFFDAFVRWQTRKLKSMGKIVKDRRYTIYSPLDGQPCADHDRASGEGVQPQEYTLIKMEVAVKPLLLKLGPSEGKRVFLAAATLRPETMYGQTNAWVLPDGRYGAYEISETDVFIVTERAALNLAYQNFSKTPQKKPSCLVELTGVPSDAPDDYMALQDLISKPDVRAKYGVKDEWVPSDIVPVCLDLKIKGQKDKEYLAEAKRLTYLKGFTEGTMLIGEFAGRKVQEINPIIKTKLVESGEAILYRQPENPVMSRSVVHNVPRIRMTFFMYNHAALMAERNWPRGIRCNGHIMLNSEKMSKSTGNFRTLRQAIEEFSATATRFSLADAGDGLDDANFVFETANAAILRLTKELTWMEEVLGAESSLRTGPPSTYADKVFENDMNIAIKLTEKAYKDCLFREALKNGFYDLQAARDEHRLSCGMNHDLILTFMDVQTRLIEPICPHFAEYVWRKLLKKQGCVVKAGWPTTSNEPDLVLKGANKYLQDSIVSMRKILQKQLLTAGANSNLKGLKAHCLQILQSNFHEQTSCFLAPDAEILAELKEILQNEKLCMPFLKFKKNAAIALGGQALNLQLPFGEMEVLQSNIDLIKRQLGLEEVEIFSASVPDDVTKAGPRASVLTQNPPSPGSPTAIFVNR